MITKLASTIIAREIASIISTLWSRPEIGLDAPKRVKGAKLDIPVPSIRLCFRQEQRLYHSIRLYQSS